jgi:hypothetical protein
VRAAAKSLQSSFMNPCAARTSTPRQVDQRSWRSRRGRAPLSLTASAAEPAVVAISHSLGPVA